RGERPRGAMRGHPRVAIVALRPSADGTAPFPRARARTETERGPFHGAACTCGTRTFAPGRVGVPTYPRPSHLLAQPRAGCAGVAPGATFCSVLQVIKR